MKTLVIGYGSIGLRHANILTELCCQVSVVSEREIDFSPRYKSVQYAIESENPEYVVIANKTSDHYDTFSKLIKGGFRGIVLIEKPLFCNLREIPDNDFEEVFVAYNMRFHPLLQKLNDFLTTEKIISVQAYVGQYLPKWRPQQDYRLNYSAKKEEGGGVLRDLSHELDYLNWICSGWKSVTATGGHYSHLEINSDDVFAIMIKTQNCPIVTVQMNYLDRISHREVLVNTDKHTVKVDFIKGTFQVDSKIEKIKVERDDTYLAQHLSILNRSLENLCTLEQGIDVMEMIQAIENSADLNLKWKDK